ncbi:hypothetical protein F0562_022026 [Nyssa sinensis]|uniref:Uncharacterized protein n=1 Tax=Nyssa sinensis TaxID=561372 RepID=A0A5J5BPS5_9ASTE|nr:hypothetical protein F0562_022026 [Nyssa sinensis]
MWCFWHSICLQYSELPLLWFLVIWDIAVYFLYVTEDLRHHIFTRRRCVEAGLLCATMLSSCSLLYGDLGTAPFISTHLPFCNYGI